MLAPEPKLLPRVTFGLDHKFLVKFCRPTRPNEPWLARPGLNCRARPKTNVLFAQRNVASWPLNFSSYQWGCVRLHWPGCLRLCCPALRKSRRLTVEPYSTLGSALFPQVDQTGFYNTQGSVNAGLEMKHDTLSANKKVRCRKDGHKMQATQDEVTTLSWLTNDTK